MVLMALLAVVLRLCTILCVKALPMRGVALSYHVGFSSSMPSKRSVQVSVSWKTMAYGSTL